MASSVFPMMASYENWTMAARWAALASQQVGLPDADIRGAEGEIPRGACRLAVHTVGGVAHRTRIVASRGPEVKHDDRAGGHLARCRSFRAARSAEPFRSRCAEATREMRSASAV